MKPLRPTDPRQVGPYPLESRLGGGGMGQVFLGRSRSGRPVAVKVVRPELAEDTAFRRRFATEVEAARAVGGFYTAQVVDADVDADPPWLVTAYIPGPSLHDAVERDGPLTASAIGELGAGLAEGLTAVHACNLVHRDLKPSNVILGDDGPRLIDFGIARALDAARHPTTRGMIGTPSYMSPEQVRGEPVGPASDVFSLAAVLAFAATGRGPFGTGQINAILYRVAHDEPDLTGVPASLAPLLSACLAKQPGDRPSVHSVLDALAAPAYDVRGQTLDATRPMDDRRASPPDARSPAEEADRGAHLRLGNITRYDLKVIVDGTELGTVQAGDQRTFPVTPGEHSVRVKASGYKLEYLSDSDTENIKVRRGATVRLAFHTVLNGECRPSRADNGYFERRSLSAASGIGLRWSWVGAILGALAFFIWGEGLGTLLLSVGAGNAVFGIGLAMAILAARPSTLCITPEGYWTSCIPGRPMLNTTKWPDVNKVAVVGSGPGAQVVVWYGGGHRRNNERGAVVCTARMVSKDPDAVELRAALKWFAGDLYVEQATL